MILGISDFQKLLGCKGTLPPACLQVMRDGDFSYSTLSEKKMLQEYRFICAWRNVFAPTCKIISPNMEQL
ncbi:MAG: hypothetical protein A2031_01535 [Deltaproteobacteria bacterium RBG_19FT_COMBO_43_11]|nr:MAG: hypothetical protein A2W27_01730 [Deltaproteobacteria bacterium RBG_16_44_11]OGP91432.1 MAG: hypothetical protein A2031_01535 [Deltaproteobacteria bacterium RBG_19FT_COMBO_43_11]